MGQTQSLTNHITSLCAKFECFFCSKETLSVSCLLQKIMGTTKLNESLRGRYFKNACYHLLSTGDVDVTKVTSLQTNCGFHIRFLFPSQLRSISVSSRAGKLVFKTKRSGMSIPCRAGLTVVHQMKHQIPEGLTGLHILT